MRKLNCCKINRMSYQNNKKIKRLLINNQIYLSKKLTIYKMKNRTMKNILNSKIGIRNQIDISNDIKYIIN